MTMKNLNILSMTMKNFLKKYENKKNRKNRIYNYIYICINSGKKT